MSMGATGAKKAASHARSDPREVRIVIFVSGG
jgi:hypothetical protein